MRTLLQTTSKPTLLPVGVSMWLLILSALATCAKQPDTAEKSGAYTANLYVTTFDQQQLFQETFVNDDTSRTADHTIALDPETTYQEIDGFGYTLTGGSALHLSKMSAGARTAILQELFGRGEGSIGVSYLRLSLGASDLDEYPWSYDDLPDGETDLPLANFSLAYDTLYLIPVLKEILQIAPEIKLMASPWSPPTWMKDNKDTRGGSLLPEYHEVYARYLLRYLQAMKVEGITIDALTIQNEPLHPGNNPSLLMLAEQQAEFIKTELGPLLEAEDMDTKLVIYDHNADRPDYPISILDDPAAAAYVDGSAFHLYGGEIGALSGVHDAHPDKNIYFTEQWVGAPGNFAEDLEWHLENLIIGATANWSKTVLEWNLAADPQQDPHTDRGGCDRCLGAITIDGDEVMRNPAYYIIAQASKYIPAGAVRIGSSEAALPHVAFKNPNGEIVTMLENTRESAETVAVVLDGRTVVVALPAKSAGTLVISNQ